MELAVKKFSDIGIEDISIVGGKNASLGEMYNQLSLKGVRVPNGFATTSVVFWQFLKENKIQQSLKVLLKQLDRKHFSNLQSIGKQARTLVLNGNFSTVFIREIENAYMQLCDDNPKEVAIKVQKQIQEFFN